MKIFGYYIFVKCETLDNLKKENKRLTLECESIDGKNAITYANYQRICRKYQNSLDIINEREKTIRTLRQENNRFRKKLDKKERL